MATFEEANDKIQQLNKTTSTYKILNAMLNFDDAQYEGFLQTKQVVADHILNCENLEELSQLYDDCFLMPMRARDFNTFYDDGQEIYGEIFEGEQELWEFDAKVRERDGNRCVLTGGVDVFEFQSNTRNGHQVAHFIPQSLLDDKKDSQNRKNAKINVRTFILALCPWLPLDFFENLDVCENALFLNTTAHSHFGAFNWFVTMETGIDGSTIYRAMQVEENGLLKKPNLGRFIYNGEDLIGISNSYNQPLFIGDSHPQPGFIYVKLHEMLARIFEMRGQAGYYEIDSDDEYEPVDGSDLIDKLSKHKQDSTKTLVINI